MRLPPDGMGAVSGAHDDRQGGPRRLSKRLLRYALIISAVVLVGGQIAVLGIYSTTIARPISSPPTQSGSTETPLVVGVSRIHAGPSEWLTFAKVFAQLQRDVGRPVVVRYALDSSESVKVLSRGEVDIALVSAIVYIKASREEPLALVAAPAVGGTPLDSLVMVVDERSDIQSLEDLRGRRLLLPPDSLAGRPFVKWLLRERGETPESFFGAIEETGAQDANLAEVAKGQQDATTVRRSALLSWPEGTFRIVAQSPGFGTSPIVARPGLESEIIDRVRDSLLAADRRGVIPTESAIDGFRIVEDADYDFARALRGADAMTAPGSR